MAEQQTTLRWIDLSDYKVELVAFKFPDGVQRLVLSGATGAYELAIVRQLGFQKTTAGSFVRDGLRVTLAEIQKVFPKARVTEMARNRVIRMASDKDQRANRIAEEILLRQAQPLGVNHLGQEVFQGVMGRFVRSGTDGGLIREGQAASPAVFLRADSDEALALCAQGFVDQMIRGRSMKRGDFEAFVRTVFGINSIPRMDPRPARVNQAIELAMAKRWLAESAAPDRHAFGVAVRLHEAQPLREQSVRREQVPLPIVAAVAAIASAGRPPKVGVVQPGNSAIVAGIPVEQVLVSEPDAAYRASSERVDAPNAVEASLEAGSVPVSISMAPGRSIPGNTVNGVFINRNDHLGAMHALAARVAQGRSVIVLSADSGQDGQAGSVVGSRDFLNWVYQNYEVEGLVEVEGNLTRKFASAWPYRVLVVGNRRPQADKSLFGPDTVPVVSSFEELWGFTRSLMPHPAPVAVAAAPAPALTAAPAARQPAAKQVREAAPAAAPAADPQAPASEVLNLSSESKQTEENSYQAPYVPFSRLGTPEAMIPRNLQAPTYRALSRVAQEHGDIDRYVAEQLGFKDPKELEPLFSPEQIDALALAIDAMSKGKGFIEGDMTGLGKGRVLAGIARWAFRNGKPVVFVSEKANLFSDYWRDLTDTKADGLCKPFIVNGTTSIINAQGEKVLRSLSAEKQNEIFKSPKSPWEFGFNLAMATYSQFSRPAEAHAKSAWLPRACENAVVILDESHNAAGDSQVNKNFEAALEGSDSVMFSSATFAKSAENMAIYRKVFPKGLSAEELRETLEAGGEPLCEVLSAALAEDGVFIRREHDMSQLTFETVVDTERLERNEKLADDMSDVLVLMAKASQLATRMVEVAQVKDKKGMLTIPNFGSRRYLANRQFMLALKLDQAVDMAVKGLEQGEKPVLVVESTMESLIREAVLDEELSDEDLLAGENIDADAPKQATQDREIKAVTFRDVLAKLFDRSITIKRTEGEDSERLHALDLNVPEALKKELKDVRDRAMALIQRFPLLAASPLDAFREKIEEAGFTSGEISGRGVRLQTVGPDTQKVVSAGNVNRALIVRQFNEGEQDVVTLTRSGSTGISMQNSPKFKDQRQRLMIEAQIFNNVAERLQVYGRCNRKGQLSPPKIVTLSTGLPGEVRSLAMQKKKLRQLSANTTSNRDSAVDSEDVLDIINPLGEEVARSFLESRPAVADRLGIDPQRPRKDASDTYVVNAITSRIEMLKVAEQREVLDDLTAEYNARLAELDAQGLNPFRLTEHDWKAKTVKSEVFEPPQSGDSVLDDGVYLKEIHYEQRLRRVTGQQLAEMQREALAQMTADLRVAAIGGKPSWMQVVKAMTGAALTNVRTLQQNAIEGRFDSVAAALAHSKPNAAKTLQEKYKQLVDVLSANLELGRVVRFENAGEKVTGVFMGMRLPAPGKEHLSGQYEVKVLRIGQTKPESYSLSTLLAGKVQCDKTLSEAVVERRFSEIADGKILLSRLVLDGNMFRCSQYAVRHKIGHAITYTDENGNHKRAVLLKKDIEREEILNLPIRVSQPAFVMSWLMSAPKNAEVCSTHDKSANIDDAIVLSRLEDGRFLLDMPKKGSMGWVAKDEQLVKVVGKSTGKHRSRVSFGFDKLDLVIRRLSDAGVRFYAPAEARKMVMKFTKTPTRAAERELEAA